MANRLDRRTVCAEDMIARCARGAPPSTLIGIRLGLEDDISGEAQSALSKSNSLSDQPSDA
jgi:hypothetical protein